MKLLKKCDEKQKDVSHRAAGLYRFDKRIYVTLKRNGIAFEL
jgi:8-oxo-dGTP diphosphatase